MPERAVISVANHNVDGLADLARSLAAEADLEGVLARIVKASVTHIDGAQHAGITALGHSSTETSAASDELVHTIENLQYRTGEGPCLSAAADHEAVVIVDDLTTDARWPVFSPCAIGHGIRSIVSFHLYTDRDSIGALNVYARPPHAFTADSVRTGTLLAAHSAAAIAAAAASADLRIALESRDVIGQAKGILMERFKITPTAAFDLLIAASQQSNRKLRDVAADLTATGALLLDR